MCLHFVQFGQFQNAVAKAKIKEFKIRDHKRYYYFLHMNLILELFFQLLACNSTEFGLNCVSVCQCETPGCDHVTGICKVLGCVTGWKGDSCSTCMYAYIMLFSSAINLLAYFISLYLYHINMV